MTDEDGEVRELTKEDFDEMRPLAEVDPGMLEAVAQWRNRGGRPRSAAPKVHIGFRLSADLVAAIRASGKGYNVRVDEALRGAFLRAPATAKAAAPKGVKPASKGAGRVGAKKGKLAAKPARKRRA